LIHTECFVLVVFEEEIRCTEFAPTDLIIDNQLVIRKVRFSPAPPSPAEALPQCEGGLTRYFIAKRALGYGGRSPSVRGLVSAEAPSQCEGGLKNIWFSRRAYFSQDHSFFAGLKMQTWTVYILNCADGKIYTGCSGNFKVRLMRHQAGVVKSTSSRLPVVVLLKITFYNKHKAFAFEKYLKSGSGRAFSKRHF